MKVIEVVAAVIHNKGEYFATQRGYGEFEGLWEFPGGKIEVGESRESALKREIQEELGVDIAVEKFLCTTNCDYPEFHLTMHCYLCSIVSGEIELREHKAARWLTVESLDSVEWLPADKEVIDKLEKLDDFSHDDAEFAAFVKKCDKLYWLYEKEKVLNLVTETFSSLPIGTKTRCIQIINDALQFEESKVIGYGRVYIFKDYFILADDLFSIWKSLLNYAETIHRKISFTDVYGYSSASSPKLGLPYNITFVIKEL